MAIIKFVVYNFGLVLFYCLISSLFIYFGIKSKKNYTKHIFFNSAAILIALTLFEFYSFYKQKDQSKVLFAGSFFDNPSVSGKKTILGYGPQEDTTFIVTAIRINGDSLIYHVTYTLKNGMRVVPNNNEFAKNKIYFLGCSVTFGDGLNDNQTLPYFFSEFSNHQYNSINYGFSGYGTHQVIKIVEEIILKNKDEELKEGDCVIYTFLKDHALRAAGHSPWDSFGPRYEVENNNLVFKGTFDENCILKQGYFKKRLSSIWSSSALCKNFFQPKIKENDILRVAEIIKSINISFKNRNVRFIVLTNQSTSNDIIGNELIKYLLQNNIEHYSIDSIFDRQEISEFQIVGDGHPNEIYNRKVANFLTKKLQATH